MAMLQDSNVATGSWDKTVKIWDTNTGKCKLTFLIGDTVYCLEVLPDNGLIVGLWHCNTMQIWDVSAGECLQILKCNNDGFGGIRCLGILPNGNIISGSSGGKIRTWDGQTVILTVAGAGYFPALGVCPNGSVVMLSQCSLDVWRFLENDRV